MNERDLAEAIYAEITSPESVEAALDLWQDAPAGLSLRSVMSMLLATASAAAIDAVLARRQGEAARTGPWDAVPHGALRERIAKAIYDANRVVGERSWADAPAATRVDCYVCADAAISATASFRSSGEAPCEAREACARHIEALATAIRDHGPTSAEGLLTAMAGAQVGTLLDAAASLRAMRVAVREYRPNSAHSPGGVGGSRSGPTEEDGYPGSLLPPGWPKRGAP